LSELERQETGALFDYSVVVVDNDSARSARETAERHARASRLSIDYHVEPEQNISLARNRAIENARGDLIALIDDDEVPIPRWLLSLYEAMIFYGSDGVLGPVVPRFEEDPPRWVLKGGFFDRSSHPTGRVLGWKNTRTGNALLKRGIFGSRRGWFDPALGSGGEDRDFFKRKIEEGRVFVWCNEAPVFETVPAGRWKRTVLLKRALLRGEMAFYAAHSRLQSVVASMVAIVAYSICLPLFLVLGHHLFMKYLVKIFDHLGKVLTFLHLKPVSEKYVQG